MPGRLEAGYLSVESTFSYTPMMLTLFTIQASNKRINPFSLTCNGGIFCTFVLLVCFFRLTLILFTVTYTNLGGGPTGVEFSAELHDLLHTEIRAHYPALAKLAKITLYDVAPHILAAFDKSLVK